MQPDPVNHPEHYKHPSGVECIEITRHHSFCIGNAIKYLWRHGRKDEGKAVEDLRKAIFYIEEEIKRLSGVEDCILEEISLMKDGGMEVGIKNTPHYEGSGSYGPGGEGSVGHGRTMEVGGLYGHRGSAEAAIKSTTRYGGRGTAG